MSEHERASSRDNPLALRQALLALAAEHQSHLWRYLRFLGCDTFLADDLTQETLLEKLRHPPQAGGARAQRRHLRELAQKMFVTSRRGQSRPLPFGTPDEAEAAWNSATPDEDTEARLARLRDASGDALDRGALSLSYPARLRALDLEELEGEPGPPDLSGVLAERADEVHGHPGHTRPPSHASAGFIALGMFLFSGLVLSAIPLLRAYAPYPESTLPGTRRTLPDSKPAPDASWHLQKVADQIIGYAARITLVGDDGNEHVFDVTADLTRQAEIALILERAFQRQHQGDDLSIRVLSRDGRDLAARFYGGNLELGQLAIILDEARTNEGVVLAWIETVLEAPSGDVRIPHVVRYDVAEGLDQLPKGTTALLIRQGDDRTMERIANRRLQLSSLREVVFENCQITDAGLETLLLLPDLERIDLADCQQLTDAGLARLAELPSLRTLGLSNCRWVTPASLRLLVPVEISELDLRGLSLTDDHVRVLRGMQQLRVLDLRGSTVDGDGVKSLTQLLELSLGGEGLEDDWDSSLPPLHALTLEGVPPTAGILEMPNLRSLTIRGADLRQGLLPGKLPPLRTLVLEQCTLHDEWLFELATEAPALDRLDVTPGHNLRLAGLHELYVLQALAVRQTSGGTWFGDLCLALERSSVREIEFESCNELRGGHLADLADVLLRSRVRCLRFLRPERWGHETVVTSFPHLDDPALRLLGDQVGLETLDLSGLEAITKQGIQGLSLQLPNCRIELAPGINMFGGVIQEGR